MNPPLRVAIRPAEGLGVSIVKANVAEDLSHQVGHGSEDPTTNAIPGDHAQPDLHLVQPGGVGGREMELHLRVTLQPGSHRRRFMYREVIQNQVNLFSSSTDHGLVQDGAYLGLRSYLLAYRITGKQRFLERAVYWAKTGLPFLYLWSLPAQDVKHGHIAMNTRLRGEQLYRNTLREPMLYGALYGYGSSQFSHHWYGLLVQWIGLVYARDLTALAEYDQTLPWKHIVEGILASALWLAYDQPPYTGYFPDAFNLERWVPSGPAVGPVAILETLLLGHYGVSLDSRTAILRDGPSRYHLTSAAAIGDPKVADSEITFTLDDPTWSHCRAILAGKQAETIDVDGRPLSRVDDCEGIAEGWSPTEQGQALLKIRQLGYPRRIRVRLKN